MSVPAEGYELGPVPKGGRDLYWCWVLNEPFVAGFVTAGFLECGCCGWVDSYMTLPTEPSAAFLAEHQFIGNVRKPEKR